ncbi:MAG: S1C family serine protease [Planctomycetales bacterium]
MKIFGAGGLSRLKSHGTGFLVSTQGHIATWYNHVLDTPKVDVVLWDGRRFEGELAGLDARHETLLKIPAENLPYFDVQSESFSASPGTRILAFSNMFKVALGDEQVSVVHGVIAARAPLRLRGGATQISSEGPVYILDAITNNSGAAGGVVTNVRGNLLGVIGKELRNGETNTWVNYAVPIETWKRPLRQLMSGETTALSQNPTDLGNDSPGIRLASRDLGLIMIPDVVVRTPPYVDEITPGSIAARGGLRPDDLIVFANDQLVPSVKEWERLLQKPNPAGRLRLVVRRGEQLLNAELSLPRR